MRIKTNLDQCQGLTTRSVKCYNYDSSGGLTRTGHSASIKSFHPTREVWQAAGEMGGTYGSAVDIFDDIDKICPEPSEITETTSGKADIEEKYRNLARKKGNCGNK